jgi:hypothetical protein
MDTYKKLLASAAWTWMEHKHCSKFMSKLRRKDRTSGRATKRSARQVDAKEIAEDSKLPTGKPCWECGYYECSGSRNG